jgi:FKBP-type peptidyl-prolyl cis-trans isomerase FkpA
MFGDLKIRFNSMAIRITVILFIIVSFFSCGEKKGNNSLIQKPGKNEMADLNRYLVQKDRERIKNYIERKNLNMTESPTGLWYQIIKEGEGKKLSDNDQVVMNYECYLLDGTKCYSSFDLGPRKLVLGKSEMEQGLNEGLKLLRPGAQAMFIIPPYLAFGLVGDRKMIPSRAVVVYNVNILQTE